LGIKFKLENILELWLDIDILPLFLHLSYSRKKNNRKRKRHWTSAESRITSKISILPILPKRMESVSYSVLLPVMDYINMKSSTLSNNAYQACCSKTLVSNGTVNWLLQQLLLRFPANWHHVTSMWTFQAEAFESSYWKEIWCGLLI